MTDDELIALARQARDAALRTGMTRGMEMGYERLDRMLAGS